MALKVVNTESLDAVANAINAKSGTSGALQFPEGFVDAIGAIQAGGGEDLSTALTEQEELVAELKSVIAQKAKLGDAKLPSILSGTVTELTADDLIGLKNLRHYAFYQYGMLESIELPDTVENVGQHAFDNCSSLKSVVLSKNITNIGYYMFSSCTSLMSVTIPNSVTSIGDYAFQSCKSLTSISIPDTVLSMGANAFRGCEKLASVTLSNSLTSIVNYAFYGCSELTNITIPSSVTTIGYQAFYKSGLRGINWHNGITRLDGQMFASTPIEHLSFPASISVIQSQICQYCSSLKSVVIPVISNNIQSRAFDGCTALEYVDMTAYVEGTKFPSLASTNVFNNCGKNTTAGKFEIRVPAGRKAELAAMTNWSTYADNIVEV